MTYAELVQKIRDYTEVDSNVLTSTIVDGIIENAEFRIFRDVDSDNNKRYATANLVASQRFIDTPDNLLIVRSAQIVDGGSGSTRNFLEYRDTSFMSEYNPDNTTGTPIYYAMWDDFVIVVAPVPNAAAAAGQVQINYIIDPPHFTSTNTTYISEHQQSLLLYGVLTESFSYLKGPMDMYNLYKTKYDEEIQAFALQQMGRRRRGEYDDGVPRIKVPSPSP